jgi:hypothetical protein
MRIEIEREEDAGLLKSRAGVMVYRIPVNKPFEGRSISSTSHG